MNTLPEIWFVTGSQHLYGPETLKQVATNSAEIVASLDNEAGLPVKVSARALVTTPDEILAICRQANSDGNCIGLIFWMHTFSPAKMWIRGLKELQKPFCHLHTQFNRDIPWASIDMDFMNLNQSAHGDREFGHICTRLQLPRKVVVGHWQDPEVRRKLAVWSRVALGWQELQSLKVVRFGDNMRQVAVTDGDKVEAESVFGFSVNTHGVGDLVAAIADQTDAAVDAVCAEYADLYALDPLLQKGGPRHSSLREAAKIELGLRAFLKSGGFSAFTDTFEDLHGLPQLPGLPVQRLMSEGYGFGGEGDWKHAALVRALKVMGADLSGGTSFMEDYTYHFDPAGPRVLGAHMLEICPSIAAAKPKAEIHPLGIGGKADPVRLVFDGATGPALNVSLIDLGHRFRLLVNEVESVPSPAEYPKLPVARVLWETKPDLATAAAAWIYAGGAHHTAFTMSLTTEYIEDLAEIAGVELVVIDEETKLRSFRRDLKLSQAAF
jgi:L-arabinose isomerase